jgi:hypothetical protein
MGLPTDPVTLTTPQLEELNSKLSTLHHNINNHLALIVASTELIKFNPDMIARMTATLMEQPPKITDEINKFAATLEAVLSAPGKE